ncbi:MAG: DNA repair photolyase [Myxococcota bacterium]|jgi:DNA repair photolyase
MDLGTALLELLAPLKPGDTLVGARLSHASTELGLRLTFERAGGHIHIEVFPDEPAHRYAARSSKLRFAYRLGRGHSPITSADGKTLCEAVAVQARANEDRVLTALRQEPGARVREITGGRLLEPAGTTSEPFFTISPYIGCLIGCIFCYARERVGLTRRLRGLPDARWGSYVDARIDAPDLLRSELAASPPHPVKFCPIVSDPYHAIESKLELTRRCLTVLSEAPPRPILLLTRARLIERDLTLLQRLPGVHVGFSIPTIDDELCSKLEPRAAPIATRFELLTRFRAAGIRTFAVVQPILPGDVDETADRLAAAVSSVSLDVLRGEENGGPVSELCPEAADIEWVTAQRAALKHALETRGVTVWDGELPPGLSSMKFT